MQIKKGGKDRLKSRKVFPVCVILSSNRWINNIIARARDAARDSRPCICNRRTILQMRNAFARVCKELRAFLLGRVLFIPEHKVAPATQGNNTQPDRLNVTSFCHSNWRSVNCVARKSITHLLLSEFSANSAVRINASGVYWLQLVKSNVRFWATCKNNTRIWSVLTDCQIYSERRPSR